MKTDCVTMSLTQIAGVSTAPRYNAVNLECVCGDGLLFSHDRQFMDYYNCMNPDCAIELIAIWAEDPEE